MNKSEIDALIERTDLSALVEQAGGKLRRQGSEYRCACPLHGSRNPTSFAVYHSGKHWKCFSGDCGGGDAIEFVKVWRNYTDGIDPVTGWKKSAFVQAIEFLGGGVQISPAEIEALAKARYEREAAELAEQIKRTQNALNDFRQAKTWTRYYELMDDFKKRALWYKRGYSDEMIDFFQVGYDDEFNYFFDGNQYTSETLTIPIWQADGTISQVKHRLLEPIDPRDKYRPDTCDLPSLPLHCDYYDGRNAPNVLYIEGEIKAEITFFTLNTRGWQVVGLPTKSIFRKDGSVAKPMIETLNMYKGRNQVVLLDPDASEEAVRLARYTGGRYVLLNEKIDDAIIRYGLDAHWLRTQLDYARKA